jgi:hypothetical protein
VKLRHAAALALVGWFLLSPPLSRAQSDTKTFTDPEGAFSFRYSDDLVDCTPPQKPSDNPRDCSSYNPVCDYIAWPTTDHPGSVACFAYPKDKIANVATFEAATFSVEVLNETEKSCLDPHDFSKHGTTRVHGLSFAVFGESSAGSNQYVDADLYRTFHKGKCYQLGIDIAGVNGGIFDPPVKDLSKADLHDVNRQLEKARKSFRFLK